eukprot:366572-Chlamydomonas_euryale.AAC.8
MAEVYISRQLAGECIKACGPGNWKLSIVNRPAPHVSTISGNMSNLESWPPRRLARMSASILAG